MSAPPRTRFSLRIPLRIVLIAPFVIQVVLVVGLVGYLSFRNGQQAVNDVAHQLRGEINARIEEHLRTFLDTPCNINQINANALGQGWLDAGDQTALERYLWQQIQIFPSVTSIYFGNTAGGLVDAGREGAAGSLYVIVTDGFRSGPFRKYATNSRGQRTGLLATVPDFDARTRPWYNGAAKKGEAAWSEVYVLFTGQDMAISASRPVYDERHSLRGVVSVDIFMSHLSDFLQGLDIGKTGQSFIVEYSGLLIAASTDEQPFVTSPGQAAPRRLKAGESSSPLIRGAAEALTQRFGNYQAVASEQQFEFELGGQRHFLQVSPVQNKDGLDWLIVTVVPESDFMGQINANNRTTVALSGLALVIAVVLDIITTQWIIRPILRLNASTQALAKGEWGQTVINGDWISEISELTQSFNRMSEQLKQMLESLTFEISERKQVEAALRESEEKYRILFNNEIYAICIFDLETLKLLDVNEAYTRLYGYSRAELLAGMTIHDITVEHQASDAATDQAVQGGTILIPLRYHRKKDGTVFPVEIVGGPYMWQGRRVMFGLAHDITYRQQAEAERERLIGELQTALVEVKQLSGLLPICSSCKKIRDDQGYWQQVEVYIQEHSEAEFSHGICPDCMKKLYPEYYHHKMTGEP